METFRVNSNEIENRLDSHFYRPEFKALNSRLLKLNHKRLGEVVSFANETWSQKDLFNDEFPYIEISGIDITTGEIKEITNYKKENAPSRARMIVRENDIIVSTTRPNRGAISFIDKPKDGFIASTGFAILRNLVSKDVDRFYLLHTLRTNISLTQMLQRSSGGNYPAITPDELVKIIIPLPTLVIQKQVVEIMQSAYAQKKQKEQGANKLLDSIDEYVLEELGIKLPDAKEKICFIASSDEVKGNRLDPKKYSERPTVILKAIKKSRFGLTELSKLIVDTISGDWGEEKRQDGYVLCKVLRNTNFDNRLNLNFEDVAERYIPEEKFKKIKLQDGDILIEKSGGSPVQPVGRVALIESIKGNYTFSNFLQCFRINKEKCLPEYIFVYLKAIYRLNYMEYLQNQTTGIKNLIMEEYLTIPVALPSLKIQENISDEVKKRMSEAQDLRAKSNEAVEEAKRKVEKIILG